MTRAHVAAALSDGIIDRLSWYPPVDARKDILDALDRAGLFAERTCAWTQDAFDGNDGCYDTACGHRFVFTDDGPKENGAKFCCYCGGALREVPYTEDLEPDPPEPIHGEDDGPIGTEVRR